MSVVFPCGVAVECQQLPRPSDSEKGKALEKRRGRPRHITTPGAPPRAQPRPGTPRTCTLTLTHVVNVCDDGQIPQALLRRL